MDFLMPGELFPLVFIGGVLLIWASLKSHKLQLPVCLSFGLALALLLGSQGLAVVTGLANGSLGKDSPWFIVVIIIFALYVLAVIALGVFGVLLYRRLRQSSSQPLDNSSAQ